MTNSLNKIEVEFNINTFNKYLEFFDIDLDDILTKVLPKNSSINKKEEIKKKITHGRVEFNILKKIANELKITPYKFYFEEFNENKEIVDFKKQNKDVNISLETLQTLRKYSGIAEDIYALLEEEVPKLKTYSINQSPEVVAGKYRKKFDFDTFFQKKRKPEEVFKYIRNKIEEENIFVFKNNITEKGGDFLDSNLSGCIFLNQNSAPLILLNSSYEIIPQIGTLLHEFAHYLIGESEIDIKENYNINKIERWCNKFAYHFLIPKEYEKSEDFINKNIKKFSKDFFVSKKSLMTRYLELKYITQKDYNDFLNIQYKKNDDLKIKKKSTSGGDWHVTKKERVSVGFIKILAQNYYSNKISSSEVAKYLGINMLKVEDYM